MEKSLKALKKVWLAGSMGFCAGVRRALFKAEQASLSHSNLYLTHSIVHNEEVHQALLKRGIQQAHHLSKLPEHSTWLISAHGVSPAEKEFALQRNIKIVDATCPLIIKTHEQIARLAKAGFELIILGQPTHVEIMGLLGQAQSEGIPTTVLASLEAISSFSPLSNRSLAFVTQTTLSQELFEEMYRELRRRFPTIEGPAKGDICYATLYRQRALKRLTEKVDAVLILGSSSSSNANKLLSIAEKKCPARLIRGINALEPSWLTHVSSLGITAAASTPDWVLEESLKRLKAWAFNELEILQDEVREPEPFIFER